MLSVHQSKLTALEGVSLTNARLKRLKITKLAKTAATATTTVSKETTSVEQGATDTTKLGQSTLGKAAKTDIDFFYLRPLFTPIGMTTGNSEIQKIERQVTIQIQLTLA